MLQVVCFGLALVVFAPPSRFRSVMMLKSEPLYLSSPLPPREMPALSLPASAQSIPLRGRDLQVLTELFDLNEIEAIESDILQNLDWRYPEPCWEDDPFEFLRDYL